MRADPSAAVADTVAAALRGLLRPDQVISEPARLDDYAHDDAEWAEYHRPLAAS